MYFFWEIVAATIVWFQKISIPPPRKTLWFAPPHPPGFSFPGSLWGPPPPSPQEFPEFLNGDFAYDPLEIQSGFGTLKTKQVHTNSVSYENTVESYYNSAV